MLAVALQDKTSSLAKPLAHDSFQSRARVARLPCLVVIDSSHSNTHPTINTLIPTKCKELPERILREKPLTKTRLTHPQSSSFDSPNFSTLTLAIDTSLRCTLAKSLFHHTHIYEKVFWCLESSLEGINSFWLMQWVITRFGKLKKTRFGVTLLEQKAWRA